MSLVLMTVLVAVMLCAVESVRVPLVMTLSLMVLSDVVPPFIVVLSSVLLYT